jgi:hypothetical protein
MGMKEILKQSLISRILWGPNGENQTSTSSITKQGHGDHKETPETIAYSLKGLSSNTDEYFPPHSPKGAKQSLLSTKLWGPNGENKTSTVSNTEDRPAGYSSTHTLFGNISDRDKPLASHSDYVLPEGQSQLSKKLWGEGVGGPKTVTERGKANSVSDGLLTK